jgi:hypothetical protein
MAKVQVPARPRRDSISDAPEEATEVLDTHLYKIVFRRVRPSTADNAPKQKMFITFGVTEDEAIDRIWNAYGGSSFQKDFSREQASAELVLGDIVKIGG